MAKSLRGLMSKRSMNAEMGGVNVGIVRKPLQPKHGRPETVTMPMMGPLGMPMATSKKNSLRGGMKQTGNVKNGGTTVKNTKSGKKEMGKVNMGKKWTRASDDAYDKKHGIKEGSKKDKALDKKKGVPETKKRKRLSPVAKETRAIKARMAKKAPYAV
ncbi:MAG TPA: hypothetical protein VF810_04000 [Patescibacteria group bacterium]